MATLIAPETVAASSRAFPAQTGRAWGRPRRARHEVGHHELTGQFRIDLRDQAPDLFEDVSAMDWSTLTRRDVGRPYRTEKWSSARRSYEQEHQQPLPIVDGWRLFNTAFHVRRTRGEEAAHPVPRRRSHHRPSARVVPR